MIPLLLFLSLIPSGNTNGEFGKASVFAIHGDKYNPENKPLACESRIIRKHGHTYWQKILTHGVAHRTLPCGSKIRVYIIGKKRVRSSYAYVVDRGPYGVVHNGRWRLRRKLYPGERYRGILDVLAPLAKKLNVSGIFFVVVKIISPRKIAYY